MSSRLFLVNVEPPEVRLAEVRDGRLFDLDIERDARLLGNIYKARVENIVPGMDAAFVNIGETRNALLYVGDVVSPRLSAGIENRDASITQLLRPREEVLVQVARPPVGSKGARVTMRLSLPGRHGILVHGTETVGVSKRVEEGDERTRLRRIAERLRPFDRGLILRTEAQGASEAHIAADLSALEARLSRIVARGASATAPALLHEDLGLLGRLARDRMTDEVSAVVIDSPDVFESFVAQLDVYAPQLKSRVQLYTDATPLFARHNVERDIKNAASRRVELAGGGSLVWDEGEALTAVDVNSGSGVSRRNLQETVVATNLEAVQEIARGLRLRDVGGIVVIDFIDMKRARDRVRVLDALEKALSDDRNRSRIVQLSPSGLVEMTRRREGETLSHLLYEPCPRCEGTGHVLRAASVAVEARRRLREMARRSKGGDFQIVAHPTLALTLLGEDGEWLHSLARQTEARFRVRADETRDRDDWTVRRLAPDAVERASLEVGALVPLPPDAPRYGDGQNYVVARNTLIQLPPSKSSKQARPGEGPKSGSTLGSNGVAADGAPGDETANDLEEVLLLEIIEAGPHFARAQSAKTVSQR